jgi:uncharacterized protein YcbK (DUF882 family)
MTRPVRQPGEKFVMNWQNRARWEHFSPAELGQPCSSLLLDALERLRAGLGAQPLPIISGRRTKRHNAEVGGAIDSQHLVGRAADLPVGLVVVDAAIFAGFTGIGDVDGFAVHVDVRPGPLVRWTY